MIELIQLILTLIPFAFLALLYLLLFHESYREGAQASHLQVGHNVITRGGLRGTIQQVRNETIIIELYGGVLVEVEKRFIISTS
jgi:preprotein translocase YajC subunit